ncbi:hypothetical protein QO588_003623 [Salmonella enterica]|nr:hypothetical protein [Salmonella enterica]EGZ4032507.1 hypothetical protein [Salmonella enterica subsp. enterica serovar Javiana]ELS7235300.1 hypothetical protein [Salmonella enterica]EMA2939225.1 hypothetical protein [Salmonella enterica]
MRILFFFKLTGAALAFSHSVAAKVDVTFTCTPSGTSWSREYPLTLPVSPVTIYTYNGGPNIATIVGTTTLTKKGDSSNLFNTSGIIESNINALIANELTPYLHVTYFSNPGNMTAEIYNQYTPSGKTMLITSNNASETRFDISGNLLQGRLQGGRVNPFVSGMLIALRYQSSSGNITLSLPEEWSLSDMELKSNFLLSLQQFSYDGGSVFDYAEQKVTCNSKGTPVTFSATPLLDFDNVVVGTRSVERVLDFNITSPSFIPPGNITFSSADASVDGKGVKLNNGVVTFFKASTGMQVSLNSPSRLDARNISFVARLDATAAAPGTAESTMTIVLDIF